MKNLVRQLDEVFEKEPNEDVIRAKQLELEAERNKTFVQLYHSAQPVLLTLVVVQEEGIFTVRRFESYKGEESEIYYSDKNWRVTKEEAQADMFKLEKFLLLMGWLDKDPTDIAF